MERRREMRVASMFRMTAGVMLVQIALGGLVTFGFIGPLAHMIWGVVVFGVAVATAVVALRSKRTDGGLRSVSLGLIAALSVQVVLELATLSLGSDELAWVHLVLGVLIYAMSLTGMSFAMRQEYTPRGTTTAAGAAAPPG